MQDINLVCFILIALLLLLHDRDLTKLKKSQIKKPAPKRKLRK
jgi:hypothetical protein